MSLAGVVDHVGRVLARAHALFGEPAQSGGVRAGAAGRQLAAGAGMVREAGAAMATASGTGPRAYRGFAAAAGHGLDALAADDNRLGAHLADAAGAEGAGRRISGRVLGAAAADTAALSPATATPAGQQALLKALRQRVGEQQQVVQAYQARDARMAALIRTLAYQRAGLDAGAAPRASTLPAPGGFGSRAGRSGVPPGGSAAALGSLMRSLTALPGGVDQRPPPAVPGIADGPGRAAAEAALTRRGAPYVWGAKGPSRFDCSGLTAWAWRQAGVALGPDTYAQIRQGVPVPPDQVRAGDLIFPLDSFGEGGRRGPGHVQLAIGGGQVVHAPYPGEVVRIAALPDRFIARRPVPGAWRAAGDS